MGVRTAATLWHVTALALLGLGMRSGVTSVGALLDTVSRELDMSSGLMAILTSVPVLIFAIGAAVAPRLILRWRLGQVLGAACILAGIGLLTRALASNGWVFILLTAIAMTGIAICNVLIPVAISQSNDNSERSWTMATFAASMAVGAALGSFLAIPIAESALSWRGALGVWAISIFAALPAMTRADGGAMAIAAPLRVLPGRDGYRKALTALFAFSTLHAYVQFGWYPEILRSLGHSHQSSNSQLAILAGIGVVTSLIAPMWVGWGRHLGWAAALMGVATAAGYIGILTRESLTPVWTTLLAVGGASFPFALALISARSGRNPGEVAFVSGSVQFWGFLIAAVGPATIGLAGQSVGWEMPLVGLALLGILMWPAAALASRVLSDKTLGSPDDSSQWIQSIEGVEDED